MISIEILAKIEEQLRTQFKQDASFVLADYFDYIAGTSTGAIIATCLSLGMSAAQVRQFYEANGTEMFDKARLWELYRYKFRDDKTGSQTQTGAGADTPCTELRTLLMMVLRNATTDSKGQSPTIRPT
jgi:predicted acylesterase/phospholipase RssA